MAAKPQMTVRLAPSILHALIYIAERADMATAELARSMLTAECQSSLDRHGWRADCQDDYMRWLVARRAPGEDLARADDVADIALVDGAEVPASASVQTRAEGPYGPSATRAPLVDDSEIPPRALSEVVADADRLVERYRPDGRKKRS